LEVGSGEEVRRSLGWKGELGLTSKWVQNQTSQAVVIRVQFRAAAAGQVNWQLAIPFGGAHHSATGSFGGLVGKWAGESRMHKHVARPMTTGRAGHVPGFRYIHMVVQHSTVWLT
jgi:hypothetical protein